MSVTAARGNMYPWVSHLHSHLRGACPHACEYCYVKHTTAGRCGHYSGPLRLAEKELAVRYDTPRMQREAKARGLHPTIFLEPMYDLFAEDVPHTHIDQILAHAMRYRDTARFVLQTKNPKRVMRYGTMLQQLPCLVGVTVESDEWREQMGKAPAPLERLIWAGQLQRFRLRVFITVEPVMAHTLAFADLIAVANPAWVNVGGDSKGHNLPEPEPWVLRYLLARLKRQHGIEIRQKTNLDRLLRGKGEG